MTDGRRGNTFQVHHRPRRPPAWLRAYRRWRWPDGAWPSTSSTPWWGHWFAVLVPYRWRAVHRWYAARRGRFWLPCPLCGIAYGGHEWRPVAGRTCEVPDLCDDTGLMSVGICPRCTRAGRGIPPYRHP